MNIMELGAIGELVGGFAVIVTIGYLAVQIRQNARSMRFLATQGMIAGQAQANLLAATHGDLAEIFNAGSTEQGYEALAPPQRCRFNCYLIGFYVQVDFAYREYLAGQLEETVWRRMADEIPAFFHSPGQARWWAQDKQRFLARIRSFRRPHDCDYERSGYRTHDRPRQRAGPQEPRLAQRRS